MHKAVGISTFFLAIVFIFTIIGSSFMIAPFEAFAYVMGSSGYRIDHDSLNTGGTSFSTSTTYSLGSTVGEIGTGYSSSSVYRMAAGYWTPEDVYISITSPSDSNLGAISGLIGGTGNASSTWLVTTNNQDGYVLSVTANTEPALKAPSASIADYSPSTSDPDYVFSILSTDARFGFTPEGSHISSRYLDNGSACNTGSGDTTDRCWDGFSTTSKTISTSNIPNEPSGTATTLKYRVQIGANKIQDSSPLYQASITVTATAL